jgi:hypothetical protein
MENNPETTKGYGPLASTGILMGIISAVIAFIYILKEIFM